MEPMLPDDDEDKRLKRDEEKPAFTIGTFLQWWVIPGFIGIFSMLFGKFIIGIVMTFSSREPLSRGVNKTADKMVEELGYLGDLDFSSTDIWAYMLFGMLLGIFIKYAYSDEAI